MVQGRRPKTTRVGKRAGTRPRRVAKPVPEKPDGRTETRPLADLEEAPYNPRTIDDASLDGLTSSIERFGLVEPIVWNRRTGHVVGGHQRVKVLRRLGRTEATVVVVDLPLAEEKALNVALNNPAIAGTFTPDVHRIIAEIRAAAADLGQALRLDELERMTMGLLKDMPEAKARAGEDDLPEDVPTRTAAGDVWTMGKHRLIVGDSTDSAVLKALLGREAADIVVTDPPYGVGYDCSRTSAGKRAQRAYPISADAVCEQCGRTIQEAKLTRHHRDGDRFNNAAENVAVLCHRCHAAADKAIGRWGRGATKKPPAPEHDPERWDHFESLAHFQDFLTRSFRSTAAVAKKAAAWYVWHASATEEAFRAALKAAGLRYHQTIVWVKPALVLGYSAWNWRCEPCIFAAADAHDRAAERRQAARAFLEAAADAPGALEWTGRCEPCGMAWRAGNKPDLLPAAGEHSNVWECGWNSGADGGRTHPTQKPVRVYQLPILKHTRLGDILLDPFAGSGTAVAAAETTGRRARVAERLPAYADAVLARWELLTGGAATKS